MSLAQQLTTIQNQMVSYYLPAVYSLGMIGNTMNIFIFSGRQYRSNVVSWYFICVSLSQLLLLNAACLARIVTVLSGYDVSRYVLSVCKFRAYLFILSLVLSRHFLCLISFDRWLIVASDVRLRQISSSRSARWIIGCSIVFWSLFSIHALVGYEGQNGGCAPSYGTFYDVFYSMYSIITAISPIIIMSVFSVLTIMNVRKSIVRRIQPDVGSIPLTRLPVPPTNISEQTRLRRKRDRQLIRLSLVQVASYLVLNITTSIYPLYSYLTRSQSAISADQQAIGSFVSTTGLILLYTYSAIIFFVYTVASSAFRRECINIYKQWLNKLQRRP